mmetsp:Transcript_104682/g.223775  ORF Transcript_104682/g.223775 Transcript_104682/m.223775 type:complete len:125 (+) Transcript_104682:86-460(+)
MMRGPAAPRPWWLVVCAVLGAYVASAQVTVDYDMVDERCLAGGGVACGEDEVEAAEEGMVEDIRTELLQRTASVLRPGDERPAAPASRDPDPGEDDAQTDELLMQLTSARGSPGRGKGATPDEV